MEDQTEISSLRMSTLRGLSWSAFSQIAYQILALAITIILARLLLPEDFGLIGMAVVFTGFTSILSKVGLSQALIHRKDLGEDHLGSAFWVSLLLGLGGALVIVAMSPFVANFYGDQRIVIVLAVIAGDFLISSSFRVPDALLRRQLNFRALAVSQLLGTFIGGVSGIALALLGGGVASLLVYQVVSSLIELVVHWVAVRWRPKLTWSRRAVSDLWRYSGHLSGAQILNYVMRNADNLLIGKFLGAVALGFYARAYNLMLLPVTQISDTAGRVMWASLARIQDNTDKIADIIKRSVRLIGFVVMPLMAGAFMVADRLVLVVLGERWLPIVLSFRLLCIVGILQSLSNTGVWIYQATGRVDVMFRWQVLESVLSIGGFLVGVMLGKIETVAAAYLLVSCIYFYFDISVSGRIVGLTFRSEMETLLPTLGCILGMCAVVIGIQVFAPAQWPQWLLLLLQIALAVGFYTLASYFFQPEARNDLIGLLRSIVKRPANRAVPMPIDVGS